MTSGPLEVRAEGRVVVARLSGDIDLVNVPTVSAQVIEAIPNDALGLVVDLSDVRYIDSAGVHMLFELVRQLDACRQGMAIALGEESPIRTLMKITHIDEAAPLCPSVEQGIAAVESSAPDRY